VRTVYLGTSGFAAAILRRLADSPHRPQLVVTRPDRPAGRGRKLHAPPVADAARELGIALDQPASVNDDEARARIAAAAPDAVVVCAFGALIKEPLLSEHAMLNVHPSLLPRWRGAAPVERAIMAGDAETGVAIMRLTAGLDSGPVCLLEREPIAPRDTYGTLAERLQALGGELLVRALDERPPFVEQGEDGVTYAEKITAADRTLDPARQSAAELDRVVRALTPHIGARLPLGDAGFLGVVSARALDAAPVVPAAGALVTRDGQLLLGAAGGTVLALETVQPPGRRAMRAADYLRGHAVPAA
jgi:methionyl-tRNA formyltransferase